MSRYKNTVWKKRQEGIGLGGLVLVLYLTRGGWAVLGGRVFVLDAKRGAKRREYY